MSIQSSRLPTATASSSIADILERVLDKGVVITGDIRIKLVDIELLTIQIRLIVCSIDKAREIGMDWWNTEIKANEETRLSGEEAAQIAQRLETLEAKLAAVKQVH